MNDEERKIIISKVSEYRQNESGEYHRVPPISPVNRWITIAILIPVVALMAVLGVFFFAAFLALLVVAVVVVGIRFWWLRRKFENATQQPNDINRQAEANQTVIIEDAQIIEETEVHRTEQKKH
jgi:cytochrome c biogenesis protein ResB